MLIPYPTLHLYAYPTTPLPASTVSLARSCALSLASAAWMARCSSDDCASLAARTCAEWPPNSASSADSADRRDDKRLMDRACNIYIYITKDIDVSKKWLTQG